MLVLACGSRKLMAQDWTLIYDEIEELKSVAREIMHGDARGVDRKVEEYAQLFNIPVTAYPANWERYGKRAGYVRNAEMLDREPDLVLAFWDGISRGTGHVIREARIRGLSHKVIEIR